MEISVHINISFKRLLTVLFLCAAFCTEVIPQDCRAKLIVNTDESNSIIKLNDKILGTGNIETELTTGKYYLSINQPGYEWDARYYEDTLNVVNCNDISLDFNFNSEIYLNTVPQDASVYSKDSLIGHTPLFIKKKLDIISVSKPGYTSKTIYINQLPKANTIQLDYIGQNIGKRFYEKNIFKILIGTIVALGATTAYFKLKADNRFDSYEMTGEKSLLDQTRRYDLISGLTMGALQVNFGILIYYFLTD